MKETFQQIKEMQAETDRIVKENSIAQKENSIAQEETDRQMKETDRKLKKIGIRVGSYGNNQGRIAEQYFYNSFKKGGLNFFGEQYDKIQRNIKGIEFDKQGEYDILLINGKSVGIIEVKHKAHENDIQSVLKKAETFRINFPKYAKHKLYLGLASFAFYSELEDSCINNGIAIIQQIGESFVVNDNHLKVF